MVRTHIIPESNYIQLTVPDNYIGKKVEVILFSEEENVIAKSSDPKMGNVSELRGKLNLSEESYKEFHQYLNNIRREWER